MKKRIKDLEKEQGINESDENVKDNSYNKLLKKYFYTFCCNCIPLFNPELIRH